MTSDSRATFLEIHSLAAYFGSYTIEQAFLLYSFKVKKIKGRPEPFLLI